MNRRLFPIEDIYISKKRRAPDMARVDSIAESIGDVGLMNPPAVCIRNDFVLHDGEICDAVPVLIYGHHRLLALQKRGEVAVECIVYDVDDLRAELMEIDENLARSELTPAEESAYILRRKAIWAEINGEETGQTLASLGGRGNKQFAAEVAKLTGTSKSGVNQKIARARELGSDINRIVGTSLDKGVEMDALIKLPHQQREEIIERASAGEQVSARPAPAQKPVAADKALDVIAKGIIAAVEPDEDAEEQRFWDFWASMTTATRRRIHRQLASMPIS